MSDAQGRQYWDLQPEFFPRLYPVKNGWHAAGFGWAVFGRTKEEAVEVFRAAQQRNRAIHERATGERGGRA